MLYFVSWAMFSLVNYLTIPIQDKIFSQGEFLFLTTVFENVVIAVFAVLSGFLADIFGRKRLAIIGFIMVGMGYASLSLFQAQAAYFYFFADGVAWGIFYVIFLITIWGDIARYQHSEKFYFLGALPFVFSSFMRYLFEPYISSINSSLIFSYASIFLFLAVLPLVYAPETLPEVVIQNHDLNSYVKKAKAKAEREMGKSPLIEATDLQQDQESEQDPTLEPAVNDDSSEYEKAKQLAEKYY
jgi:MFS family permease